MQVMMIYMFAYSLTNETSFLALSFCPTFVKFWTLFYAFDICVATFFSHYASFILIEQFVFPSKNLVFNFFFSIFSHLFTMFLNPIVEISLSSYSNSLSKGARNFSKEFGVWPSHDRTLTSSIWGINVFHYLIPNILTITTSSYISPHFYFNLVRFFANCLLDMTY